MESIDPITALTRGICISIASFKSEYPVIKVVSGTSTLGTSRGQSPSAYVFFPMLVSFEPL